MATMGWPSRYRVVRQLRQGAEGSTVLATDSLRSGRHVVLKRVPVERARQTLTELERLQVRVHPHLGLPEGIVRTVARQAVIVTPYFSGGDLEAWVQNHPSLADRLAAASDILRGIRFLHDCGVLHRDVKPSNAVIDVYGHARLIDFGGAIGEEPAGSEDASGAVEPAGTIAYWAPELRAGHRPTQSTDLWAFGRLLHWLTTPSGDVGATRALMEAQHDLIGAPNARELRTLILELTADNPAERISSAAVAQSRLESVCASMGIRAHETPESVRARLSVHGFFGREAQLQSLRTEMEALEKGQSAGVHVWELSGDTGSGRTEALEWARNLAVMRGFDAPEIHPPAAGADLAAWLGLSATEEKRRDAAHLVGAVLRSAIDTPWWIGIDDYDQCPEPVRNFVNLLVRGAETQPRARIGVALSTRVITEGSSAASDSSGVDNLEPFASIHRVELASLDEAAVQALASRLGSGETAPKSLARDIVQTHGGHPAAVQHALGILVRKRALPTLGASSFPTRLPPEARKPAGDRATATRSWIDNWSAPEQRVMNLISALGAPIDVDDAENIARAAQLTAEAQVRAVLISLTEKGALVHFDGPRGPQLAAMNSHVAEAAMERELLTVEVWRSAAESLGWLGNRYPIATSNLYANAGETALALDWALRAGDYGRAFAHAERLTLEDSLANTPTSRIGSIAVAYARSGANKRAKEVAAELARREGQGAEAAFKLAELALEAGHPREAVELLSSDALQRRPPMLQALMARAHLTLGEYEAAASVAQSITGDDDADSKARFHAGSTQALAALYQGDPHAALARLETLVDSATASGFAHERPFLLNAMGISHQRLGALDEAERAYGESLASAEAMNLAARIGIAEMNLGTVSQERGFLSKAWRHYGRAERVARQTGDDTALVKALMNQANLAVQAGASKDARRLLDLGSRLAQRLDNAFIVAYLDLLSAECDLRDSKLEPARLGARNAASRFRELGSVRETAECELIEARALLQARKNDELDALIESLQRSSEQLKSTRLVLWARWLRVEAERSHPTGAAQGWVQHLRDALETAGDDARPEDRWRPQLTLAWASVAAGNGADARQWASSCLESLTRLANQLEDPLRSEFKAHPEHHRAEVEARAIADSGAKSGDTGFIARVLELNKRLAVESRPHTVVEIALDMAIATTSAERGFILIPHEGETADESLKVEFARNFDRESVADGELKLSSTIARDVFVTGQAILTVDAQTDSRLNSLTSVHAKGLRSVLAVPLTHRGAPIGVIYVDNRFQTGAFEPEHLEFLRAFADQAGIALSWAQTLEAERASRKELEASHAELATSRAEVAALNEQLQQELDRQTALLEATQAELAALEPKGDLQDRWASMVGISPSMQRVFSLIKRVKDTGVPVLVTGESGTGKELVARALHFESKRSKGQFVSINCAALPETLLEAELFGATKGSYTGADRDRKGLFEQADGGTLFLDELGEMSLSMQVKLLRTLETGEVRPVGSNTTRKVDARIIAATNRDLQQRVEEKEFREDLYFRLNVVQIKLPPLRERPEDIGLLVSHFLQRISDQHGLERKKISQAAFRAIREAYWPGNIRELQATLTAAVLLSEGEMIQPSDLSLDSQSASSAPGLLASGAGYLWDGQSTMEHVERQIVESALEQLSGNKSKTARALGIDRNTLYAKIAKYGIAKGK